jgi:hypothetical protein
LRFSIPVEAVLPSQVAVVSTSPNCGGQWKRWKVEWMNWPLSVTAPLALEVLELVVASFTPTESQKNFVTTLEDNFVKHGDIANRDKTYINRFLSSS